MDSIIVTLLVACILTVCLGQTDELSTDALSASKDYVAKECKQKLQNIDSLSKFEIFMKNYDTVVRYSSRPEGRVFDKGLKKCFDIEKQLLALQDIISKRHNGICRMEYIDQLSKFHSEHIIETQGKKQTAPADEITIKTNYAAHIFSLIAHQVVYTCKGKLKDRIRVIPSKNDCLNTLSSILPQDVDKSPSDTADQEENVLSAFLENFRRVDDLALIPKQTDSAEPYFNIVVSKEVSARIENIKNLCRQQEPYYRALFEPIVSLSQLGYNIQESTKEKDGVDNADDKVMQCWLATAQLCQGILRAHVDLGDVEIFKNDDEAATKKLVGIKFGKIPDDIRLDYSASAKVPEVLLELNDDSFDEILPIVAKEVKKKASLKRLIKRKLVNWAKKFVKSHIDIDALQNASAQKFMAVLTEDKDNDEHAVAFAGKQKNQGQYAPYRMLTDDLDFFFQSISIAFNKGIGLILNSVIAICLTAVTLWFAVYAIVTSVRNGLEPDLNGNFKNEWRQLSDKRAESIKKKVKSSWLKDHLLVYKSPTS